MKVRSLLTRLVLVLAFFTGVSESGLPPVLHAQTLALPANAPLEADADLEFANRLSGLVKRVARLGTPSVVHIEAEKAEQKQGRTEEFEEAGSGILVSLNATNYVLTNRHVIHNAKNNQINLRLHDGREFHPSSVLADAATDVALLRIDSPDLVPARIGDSSLVQIGDFVVAIGSPFGLSHSLTFGILSARGRRSLSLGTQEIEIQDFFQTDAAINPGNSGGPLLNLRGEVIGLNTAIASNSGGSEGIGFAIPINMVMRIAQQLATYGQLRRGYFGVTLDPNFAATDAMALGIMPPGGARVKAVETGSPASLAGVQVEDVVLSFDGVPVDNDDHLVAIVGLTEIDRPAQAVVFRQGKRYRVDVTLTQRNR